MTTHLEAQQARRLLRELLGAVFIDVDFIVGKIGWEDAVKGAVGIIERHYDRDAS